MKKLLIFLSILSISCSSDKTENKTSSQDSLQNNQISQEAKSLDKVQASADTVSFENIKIKPGDLVPDFSAQDENSKIRKLSDLRGKKNLMLIFFRGYW